MASYELFWLTLCTCLVFGVIASPTKKKLVETTSDSAEKSVTSDADNWDDSDGDFDFKDTIIGRWVDQVLTSSIPPYLLTPDYEEGDDDSDDDDDDSDVEQQDAEESNDSSNQDSELFFLSPKDTRLVLEDDDGEQSGLIKVRHSSKNSYSEPQEDTGDNSVETIEKGDSDGQFVFTIDEDDDTGSINKVDKDGDDDFVLEDTDTSDDGSNNNFVKEAKRLDDDDDAADDDVDDNRNDDDDNDNDDEGQDDEDVFENPEEDAQVIYGDHVFLY